MSGTMVGRRRNILKSHRLKRPEPLPKRLNLEQKINDLKPHIWSLSLNFGFSSRKSQTQQKLAKAISHFTIQFCSKNFAHFTKLNSLNIVKNILPQQREKPYSLHKFSSKHVFGCSQKKYLHCTNSRCSRTVFSKHLESNLYSCISP